MTRKEFLHNILKAHWHAHENNPTWIRVYRTPRYRYPDDGPIDTMATIEIVVTSEGQINLIFPSRFASMCPGMPGQMRAFRVVAADWADAWTLIHMLYTQFASLTHRFSDIVELCVPAERLIPDDLMFFTTHRGPLPSNWNKVAPTEGD